LGAATLGYRIHINKMRSLAAASPAAALCLSLMLAQGLIASSLLVECLPGDGRSLIELIGQDPCREPFIATEAARGRDHAAPFLGEDDPADPCVDLSMDNFGMTQGAVEIHLPSMSVTDHLDETPPVAARVLPLPAAGASFKRARDPVMPADFDSRLPSSLRI
jgi:hypothetical protein